MINSLKNLFKTPYNRQYPIHALSRFTYWKIIRLLRLKNIKYSLWHDKKIYLNYDSFQSMWIMYNYMVDWEEFNLIRDYVKASDHVADVGANMGFYTIWMSKFIGSTGFIHSFEPDENNFYKLKKNCELNKLANVKLNQLAVSDSNGELAFTQSLDGENHISLNSVENTTKVKCITFDTYCESNQIKRLSYIKVDIEGFELFFLKGAYTLMQSKSIDIIQLELNSQVKNSITTISDVLEQLQKTNYSLCRYDTGTKVLIKTDYSNNRENYFAVADVDNSNKKLRGINN